jgi:hypothetical protein
MIVLGAVLVIVFLGWALIGPRILPPATPPPSGESLDGRWTRTPDEPMATTLTVDGAAYALSGALPFTGSGRLTIAADELSLTADPSCPEIVGKYGVQLGDVGRFGLLAENRAQTMSLTLLADDCAGGSRAEALTARTWVLRASGRDDAHGICDPPNEEAAVTGHWPEPSGCGQASQSSETAWTPNTATSSIASASTVGGKQHIANSPGA